MWKLIVNFFYIHQQVAFPDHLSTRRNQEQWATVKDYVPGYIYSPGKATYLFVRTYIDDEGVWHKRKSLDMPCNDPPGSKRVVFMVQTATDTHNKYTLTVREEKTIVVVVFLCFAEK